MFDQNLLKKYARLAIRNGVNVAKGQLLVIKAEVSSIEFVRHLVEEAYEYGAKEVVVLWSDAFIDRLNVKYQEVETLTRIPQWIIDRQQDFVDRGVCFLHVSSEVPGLLKDMDPSKLKQRTMAVSKAMEPFRYYTMSDVGQWTIVALPNPIWAKMIFPDLEEEAAMQASFEAMLKAVRVDKDNDPIAEWDKHNETLHRHSALLNNYNFKSLHFKNSLGTDLVVDLAINHIWAGGSSTSQKGIVFNPNMPTEEVFTMPKRDGVNGVVVATKPLSYQGKLIENFKIEFKDGKAVKWEAEKGEDALTNLIHLDDNSSYLGEVALISHDSPISNLNLLFYNTLFDENASCHLALGAAYPSNLKGGIEMSKEELLKAGANVSMAHSDFMFGSACMNIVGTTFDQQEVVIFKDGNFVI